MRVSIADDFAADGKPNQVSIDLQVETFHEAVVMKCYGLGPDAGDLGSINRRAAFRQEL